MHFIFTQAYEDVSLLFPMKLRLILFRFAATFPDCCCGICCCGMEASRGVAPRGRAWVQPLDIIEKPLSAVARTRKVGRCLYIEVL